MSASRRAFWALAAVTLVLYGVILFWSLPHIAAEAGGLKPFDVRPAGYSEAEARAFLAALSAGGRDFYLNVQHRLDFVYPILVALTFAWAFVLLFPRQPLWRWLLIAAAVAGAAFDEYENHLVSGLLLAAPADVTAADIAAASRATILKGLANTVCSVGVLAGLVQRYLRRRRRRQAV
jgi:hypothetical protein